MSDLRHHPLAAAESSPSPAWWRAIAAWAALLAVLLLPVAHAVHVACEHPAVAPAAPAHPPGGHGGPDDDDCAVCFAFHAICIAQALLTITFAFLFRAPPARPTTPYRSPTADRTRPPRVAIPRGPPALAFA